MESAEFQAAESAETSMESSSIQYRPASSIDVDAMAACRAGDAESGPADGRMARYLEGKHHPQQALVPRAAFVALDGATVVGYIAGHLTRRYDCDGELQYLYVAASHRRGGVATELLRHLACWFVEQGAHKICVDVNLGSPAAQPFYARHGAVALNKYWMLWNDIRPLCERRI